jgi:hypothetical protein
MHSKIEEFCKDQFNQYLTNELHFTGIVWEDGEDPPDYYVDIGGLKLAIEVTTIMESVCIEGRTLPSVTVTDSLWRIVEEAEKEAKNQGILHGVYTVHFRSHISNMRKKRPIIIRSILSYILQTQSVATAPEEVFELDDTYLCAVEKLEDGANMIAPTGPDDAKWEGEIREQVCELLQARINEKVYKLRNCTLPKALLLYDAYHLAEPEMYQVCLSKIAAATAFQTIFITNSNQFRYVLSTQTK